MKATPSQNSKILRHLMKGNSITPIQALNKFDTWRLSARIENLRTDGFPIITDLITKGKKTFASYRLEENYRPL